VIKATDYQTAAQALQTAGYATDPSYAQKLINIIQKYDLQRYDRK
jgi:lysozyme